MHNHSTHRNLDTITLRNFSTQATIGLDSWARPHKPQPVSLIISLGYDTAAAGDGDDIGQTFSYGVMGKGVSKTVQGPAAQSFDSIEHLTNEIAWLAEAWPGEELRIEALAPKALLRVEGGLARSLVLRQKHYDYHVEGMERRRWEVQESSWTVKGLKVPCIIGVNPHERLEKQTVVIDFTVSGGSTGTEYYTRQHERKAYEGIWRLLVKKVCEVVEPSRFQTLEALAALIARNVLETEGIAYLGNIVEVAVEKPSALVRVEGAGVRIMRDMGWLEGLPR